MSILHKHICDINSVASYVDFLEGAVFLIDKPLGWTSFDVVNKVRFKLRHSLGIKKIKVGHAGTLDPSATGLLLICTGKLTKKIDELQAQIKEYSGSFFIGATTATFDSEVPPNDYYNTDHINQSVLTQAALPFIGVIDQIPPIYSAIKIDGKTAYNLARKGKEVVIQARKVEIQSFEITSFNLPEISFYVVCSKGTYVRSLAYDYGKKLESGAYLASLRREAIGSYRVNRAFTLDGVLKFIEKVSLHG